MQELTLYQTPTRPWKTPNVSPFCAKLECYLRMTDIPYKAAAMRVGKAPKGKIPYIDFGDGNLMGDSQLIIEELERRLAAEGKPGLDTDMPAHDVAVAHLARRAIEEGYYFVTLYWRWKSDDGYGPVRDAFKKFVPGIVMPVVRRAQKKKLHHQGTGRHTFDEVMQIGRADFDAFAQLLGDKPYLFGDRPRVVDCSFFAFLEGTLGCPVDTPIKQRVESHPNLVAYRQRIRDRWWKDLALE